MTTRTTSPLLELDSAQDVLVAVQSELLIRNLHRVAAVLRQQYSITRLRRKRSMGSGQGLVERGLTTMRIVALCCINSAEHPDARGSLLLRMETAHLHVNWHQFTVAVWDAGANSNNLLSMGSSAAARLTVIASTGVATWSPVSSSYIAYERADS